MKINHLGPVIADIDGIELNDVDKDVLTHPKLGGLIFFSRNFESIEQLKDLVRSIREWRPEILLCVDQEGGRVQRFKDGFTRLPAMGSVAEIAGRAGKEAGDFFTELGWLMASELTALDIDHSFAPVLDVHHQQSAVIGDRAFADCPEQVISYSRAFMKGMLQAGMSATAKHYPGHGGVSEDSHMELPVDSRILDEVLERDARPFIELKETYRAVMTAHIVFSEVDTQPVSFSRAWLQQILRKQIGYDGLILSDDLSMKGAANAGGFVERSVLALESGCDAILICNRRAEAEHVLEQLEAKQVGEHDKLRALKRLPREFSDLDDASRKHNILNVLETAQTSAE